MAIRAYYYSVKVITETQGRADTAIEERLGPDEDYGFDYSIEYTGPYIVVSTDFEVDTVGFAHTVAEEEEEEDHG